VRSGVPLSVSVRNVNRVSVLDLTGELILGPSLGQLRTTAATLLNSEQPVALILNTAKLRRVDSAGLGELVSIYSSASRQQCPFFIVGANPHLRSLLRTTRLDGIFRCYQEEAQAIASVNRLSRPATP